MIGEGGVSIIARRVNEMGFLYHDRRVDHGIDGEIELVAANGDALNAVVMVQSKASNQRHSYETADSFQWTADPADLDYWLGGNAPVIVVLSRPAEDLAWWFDVRAEFSDPRRRAERTVTISKHTQSFDKAAAAEIMRLGVSRESGLYLPPPPKKEVLTTNLLPVEEWPDTVFVAPATVRDYAEGWERLKLEYAEALERLKRVPGAASEKVKAKPPTAPGWILHDGMVISFGDPDAKPLSVLCDSGVERQDTADWADSDDEDRIHQFADLLRRTLVSERGADLQWHQARHHMHFRATHNLKARVVGRGNGNRGRTVFAPHYANAEPARVSYYHHAAVNPRFRRVGGRWFCQLSVGYCFTHDGKNESSFADSLLAGIKRLDRHPAVVGWTRMWERYLQGDLFTADCMLGFGSLLTFEVDRGIDDALWGPAPATSADEDSPDGKAAAEVDAALHLAGVDQDDLLSLLAEATEPAAAPARTAARRRPAKRSSGTAGRSNRRND